MLLTRLLKAVGTRRRRSADELLSRGTALLNEGAWRDATACFERALRIDRHNPALLNNLGLCYANAGELDQACRCFAEMLRIAPGSASALMNLGNVESSRGNFEEAILRYEAALAGENSDPGLLNNLGIAYRATAQVDESVRIFRRALALKPGLADAHDNLIFSMQALPECDPEALYAEHCRWAQQHEAPVLNAVPALPYHPQAKARLRIGYVSPDFRSHSVAKFIEPVIAHHDHARFEVHCYHNSHACDTVTERIRPLADRWHEVEHLTDEQLAAAIREDGMDILVDLAGHTRGSRLLCFARKPAPLQLTYLGYPNTTGMRSMDYRVTDAVSDPIGYAENFHSERLLRLPHAQWCFRPDPQALPIGPLPALSSGHVTFGSFNSLWKINSLVIEAWSRILMRTPESRLLILGIPGPSTRSRFEAAFAQLGVDPARLALHPAVPDAEFWRLRSKVDIALDPFPYNGVTSTCEALWAGTPVASLAGSYGQSRAGASLLGTVGLRALVANTLEEYVEIIARLASDLRRLSELRAGLRQRMEQSPLMDYGRFTAALEDLYRQAWDERIAGKARA